jgi:DNA-binding XRE family transcriptional regulator
MAITIKAARVNAGLTQTEVAKSLGKSKNTIVNYETYNTVPDIQTAQAMAALFGMTVNDIVWSKE